MQGEKSKMQTLDGVLTRKNPEGEKQSITSRCADLNREVKTQRKNLIIDRLT